MEVERDIAVTHYQEVDIWVRMWPPHLRQLIKTRFENSNCNYNNDISDLNEKQFTSYRKALKDLSNTLAEAVSEQWKERMEEIKKLDEQTSILTPNEGVFSQRRRHPLPANQPTIKSF